MASFDYSVEIRNAEGDFVHQQCRIETASLYCCFPAILLQWLGHKPDAVRAFRKPDDSVAEMPIASIFLRLGDGPAHSTVTIFGDDDRCYIGRLALDTFGLAADEDYQVLRPTVMRHAVGMRPVPMPE